MENYRRRSDRELERRVQERGDALLLAWLDVVDSVERALAVETDANARAGLQAVLQQMQAILARHGVTRAGEVGAPFDPERHEAVARGGMTVCAGRVALTHGRTRRLTRWAYAAVHLGGAPDARQGETQG